MWICLFVCLLRVTWKIEFMIDQRSVAFWFLMCLTLGFKGSVILDFDLSHDPGYIYIYIYPGSWERSKSRMTLPLKPRVKHIKNQNATDLWSIMNSIFHVTLNKQTNKQIHIWLSADITIRYLTYLVNCPWFIKIQPVKT